MINRNDVVEVRFISNNYNNNKTPSGLGHAYFSFKYGYEYLKH